MSTPLNTADARDPVNYETIQCGSRIRLKCRDCGRYGDFDGATVAHSRNCDLVGARNQSIGPRAAGEDDPIASLPTEGSIVLSGNSYPHRGALREAGGVWDGASKTWTVPAAVAADLLRRFVDLRVAALEPLDRMAQAAKDGTAYAAGVTDKDLDNMVRAGVISMSDAMNQDC